MMNPFGNLLPVFFDLGILLLFLAIPIYIYWAFAYMIIAQKLKYKKPWLAWVPIANLFLLPILAKKEWQWGFLLLVPIINSVFIVLWTWQIYERRKYPGWLSLVPILSFIPSLGFLAIVANLIIVGFVAWKDR